MTLGVRKELGTTFNLSVDASRAIDDPVERREPVLADFTPFCGCRVELRSISESLGAQIFSNAPNAALHIVPLQTKCVTVVVYSAERNMNMRVLRVVSAQLRSIRANRPLDRDPLGSIIHALDASDRYGRRTRER